MAKVTSKLQLTLPKAIAEQYKISPGDDLDWLPAGEAIRVVKRAAESAEPATLEQRLQLFDQATTRQAKREREIRAHKRRQHGREKRPRKTGPTARPAERGWIREELYQRGLPR